jgi:hypothetical protein
MTMIDTAAAASYQPEPIRKPITLKPVLNSEQPHKGGPQATAQRETVNIFDVSTLQLDKKEFPGPSDNGNMQKDPPGVGTLIKNPKGKPSTPSNSQRVAGEGHQSTSLFSDTTLNPLLPIFEISGGTITPGSLTDVMAYMWNEGMLIPQTLATGDSMHETARINQSTQFCEAFFTSYKLFETSKQVYRAIVSRYDSEIASEKDHVSAIYSA